MISSGVISTVLQCLVFCVTQIRSESINITGKDCKVTEPIYNHTFDLNPLSESVKYANLNGDDRVDFNLCGELYTSCLGKSHVGACYRENGTQHILGLRTDPILSDGRIQFNYKGDDCEKSPGKTYGLQIILMCDYSNNINITSEYNDCNIYIFLRTHLACLPLPTDLQSNNCTAFDPKSDHIFNLTALSQYNNRILNNDNTTFVINVCKPVLYSHAEMCPPGSSICMENKNISNLSKKFVNYGSTVANPIYENGKLFMHFKSNEKCDETHNISSHINFNCDTSIEIGEPEYLGKHECEYRFIWSTALACNSVQPCVTIDSRTGFKYDLSTLAGKQYSVEHGNKTYLFGICNGAQSPCEEKVGICEKIDDKKKSSMGLFNNHLKFNQTGSPYLLYNGGSVCSKPSIQWTTKIEFLCDKSGSKKKPILVENTDCQIVIQYMTDLVCQNEITCRAYNHTSETIIDLSPLTNFKSNYLAKVSKSLKSTEGPPILHYLNVCKHLVPQYGLSCPGGSSACRALNGTTTPTSELSLGYPDVSIIVVGNRALLKYFKGSTCPSDPSTGLSSVIEFYCDVTAGRGTPILLEILDQCHYRYEWATSVICPSQLLRMDENKCEIYNDHLNVTLNLKKIIDKGTVSVKLEPESFDLNICANNRKVESDYAQGTVKVFFDGKGPCKPDDSYSVEMRLVCKESEKHILPSETDSCGLVLIRETPLICPLLGITINPSDDSTKPDTTDTDANGEHAGGIPAWGAVFIVLTIMVCIGGVIYMAVNPVRRAKVISLFGRRNVSVQYSRIRSDEEASLLLSQEGSLTDSDDDLLT